MPAPSAATAFSADCIYCVLIISAEFPSLHGSAVKDDPGLRDRCQAPQEHPREELKHCI